MIPIDEIKNLSTILGVPPIYIEKDYAMGWILKGIYEDNFLSSNFVFKGGNCLRKIYFPYTRFSDDLDFTISKMIDVEIFKQKLHLICKNIYETVGIDFNFNSFKVEEKNTPDPDSKAIEGRVYFKGFAGDSSLNLRIKFDLSEYETIILPLQKHSLIHEYSDSQQCKINILSYSVEEILAEKLRSWIQRTRARDLFDVAQIIKSKIIPINYKNILSVFFKKTMFKNIPQSCKEEMLYDGKFKTIQTSWKEAIICPNNTIILFENALNLFKDFISALFNSETLTTAGAILRPTSLYSYRINPIIRESIIQAGKERKLLRLRYENKDRDIEPYSFRFKNTSHGAYEYFYGFDRTRGQTIKSFFLHKIQSVSILPNTFQPRWIVEF
jgi:predicted nucleotidyltransferase component of viral defense system